MKKICVTILFFFYLSAGAQQWQWARGLNLNFSDAAWSNIPLVVDHDGNIYMMSQSTASQPTDTAFIVKLNSSGTELWRKLIINARVSLTEAATDGKDLFITGNFTDSLQIDNTTIVSNGSFDGFLAHFDENGNLVWIRKMGGKASDAVYSVCIDAQKNLWTTGGYSDTAYFSSTSVICHGDMNMFIAEYDGDGNVVYVKSASSAGNMGRSYGQKIRCGLNNNLYVLGGYFEMLLDTFYLGPYGSPYNDPQFLVMLDTAGIVHWLYSGMGGFTRSTSDFSVSETGSVYYTDSWNWTSDAHLFVNKLDANGNLAWTKSMDRGYPCYLQSGGIASHNDYFYTAAHAELFYYNGNNFDGGLYLLLAKYDTSGTLLLTDTIPTTGSWIPSRLYHNPDEDYFLLNGMFYANGSPVTCSITLGNDTITSSDGNIFIAKFTDGIQTFQSSLSNQNLSIQFFPNPTTSSFTLNCPQSTLNSQLKIYNSFGQLIHQQVIKSINQQIDLSNQPKGIYIVDAGNERRKIVLN